MLRVAKLDRRGFNQYDIARLVGVSQPQVCAYLKTIRKRYQQAQLETQDVRALVACSHYADVRQEAWDAWEITKGGVVKELVSEIARQMEQAVEMGLALPETVTVKLRAQPANEFLTTILKTVNDELELYGVPAPKRTKMEMSGGVDLTIWDTLATRAANLPEQIPDDVEARVMRALPAPTTDSSEGERPNGFREHEPTPHDNGAGQTPPDAPPSQV